ncbi:MAG: hypothetical protein NZ927_03125 [Candidatus Calescibacterium sp.]|nr:hypothetical protein [Candidatus Calescibacterium sp.]MDW8086459.1 hypothetical protein [Candidatus Calescibacterium sp.]
MIKKALALSFILIFGLCIGNLYAFEKYGGNGYFLFSGHIVPFGDINSFLKRKGYPQLEALPLSIGGGGYAIIGRIIIGGEGRGVITGGTGENQNYKTSFSLGYGYINIGYNIFSTKQINLYPTVGIGGGAISVSIEEKKRIPSSIDEAVKLENLPRKTELSRGSLVLNIAIGGDYLLGKTDEKGAAGFITGFRIGYILPVVNSRWSIEGTDLNKGPDLNLSGFYFSVVLGGGGSEIK